MTNGRTYNGRFGASGAVRCWKNWYNFCREFLCMNGVEAATSPSRWDVIHPMKNVAEKDKR